MLTRGAGTKAIQGKKAAVPPQSGMLKRKLQEGEGRWGMVCLTLGAESEL